MLLCLNPENKAMFSNICKKMQSRKGVLGGNGGSGRKCCWVYCLLSKDCTRYRHLKNAFLFSSRFAMGVMIHSELS